MDIQTVLDRSIAYHRCFVPIAGGVAGAVFLSQLLYWSKRATQKDGSIYKTQRDWEEETGLGRREQEAARKALREAGVLTEAKRSIPRRLYFKLDVNKLASLLNSANKDAGIQQASLPDSADKDVGIQQANTESTAENTAENTTNPSRAREASPVGDVGATSNGNPSSEKCAEHESGEAGNGAVVPADKKTRKSKPGTANASEDPVVIPEWVPVDDWNAFVENRKFMKAPMSNDAQRRVINELAKLAKEGNNLSDVLNQSITNNWRGVFPVKGSTAKPDGKSRHVDFIGGVDTGKVAVPGSQVVFRLADLVSRGGAK